MTEPIAIIGAACRLPRARTLDAYWQLLRQGVCAVGPPPAGRWPGLANVSDAALRAQVSHAGFLDDYEAFDATRFHISKREAAFIDPHQRLLVEMADEAFGDAGLDIEQFAGRDVGVFVGMSANGDSAYDESLVDDVEANIMLRLMGLATSVAANRVSYTFALRGPSLVVDTACSASLVAMQQACVSLERGESELALAGGIALLFSPQGSLVLARAGVLSKSGRCRSFDVAADGYARGEGGGLVLLKRLSDAERDGDDILAVILGGAVNHGGRSNGLSAPSRAGQEAVLQKAYAAAALAPSRVHYVEAHGTGTPLGDPIELNALSAVVNAERPAERPCLIGSVKTNIGHLEAGAGIAAVLKVALALKHAELPPSLFFQTLNPFARMREPALRVVTEHMPWPRDDVPRVAGVSSFGMGGTNAHLVLQAAPLRDGQRARPKRALPQGQAERYPWRVQWGASRTAPEPALADACAELTWVALAADEAPQPEPRAQETWLVLADAPAVGAASAGGVGDALVERLATQGHRVIVAYAADAFAHTGSDRFSLRPTERADLERLLDTLDARALTGVIHLWSLDTPETTLALAQTRGAQSVLALFPTLLGRTRHGLALWLGTRGVLWPRQMPAHATLWGIGRAIKQEHPGRFEGGLFDLDADIGATANAGQLAALLARADQREDQLVLRNGQWLVARLVRDARATAGAAHAGAQTTPFACRANATYLVLGATGTLGHAFAEHLCARGAKHLVLASRHVPLAPAGAWGDARIVSCATDVTQEADVQNLAATLRDLPPLAGVVFAAGQVTKSALTQLDGNALQEALAVKLQGAWLVHRYFGEQPLDFFVLFSSLASLMPTARLGGYAAANNCLDALAHYRTQRGQKAVSVNFGPWVDTGTAPAGARTEQTGLLPLQLSDVPAVWERIVQARTPQLVIARADWAALQRAYPAAVAAPIFSSLVSEKTARQRGDRGALRRALRGQTPADAEAELRTFLRALTARILATDAKSLDQNPVLASLGFDSLMLVELRGEIEHALALDLGAIDWFADLTLGGLLGHIHARLAEVPR